MLKHPENPEGIFRVFRESFFCKTRKTISRISHCGLFGKWRGALERIVSLRGGPPARLPARCTVATASRRRVRRCFTCRGAPPPPRGGPARKTRLLEPLPGKSHWIFRDSRARKIQLEVRLEIPGNGSKKTPVFPGIWEIRVFEGGKRTALTWDRATTCRVSQRGRRWHTAAAENQAS